MLESNGGGRGETSEWALRERPSEQVPSELTAETQNEPPCVGQREQDPTFHCARRTWQKKPMTAILCSSG